MGTLTISADHKAIHDDWQKVLDGGVFTQGKFVRLFEEEVEKFYGYPAVALNSAGTALFATMRAYGFGNKGHSAIVPVNTFFATGAMVAEAGITPIIVDASMATFCLSLEEVHRLRKEGLIHTPSVKAMVYTTVGGGIFRPHYTSAAGYAAASGMAFVTDAAHSLGIGVGALGRFGPAIFSLFPTKALPAGEGGVVIDRNPDFIGEIRDIANYSKFTIPMSEDPDVIRYRKGFNFRMDEWTAVVAYHQMKALPEILEKRAIVADKIKTLVEPMLTWNGETNWYRYIIGPSYKSKINVGKVYARTDQLDIAMQEYEVINDDSYLHAKWVAENHQCLPVFSKMYSWSAVAIEGYFQTGWEPLI